MPNLLPPAERRSVILVVTYAALSLLLLVVGEHIPVTWLRGVGAVMFAPFDRAVGVFDHLFVSWDENDRLHERVARLEVENARLQLMASENGRLREQAGLTAWRGLSLKPVEVLALGGGTPLPDAATLSAGSAEGIRVGDAVLTSEGLVGRVAEVWPHLSRATLITDPNQAVACEVETTGVQGILRFSATPRPRLLLSAISIADTVRVGERIATSDISVRFPRGIPVGTVTRLERDATGLMQVIEVAPSARLARLRLAFVAPGPPQPTDGVVRPRLEFEPQRIRTTVAPDTSGRKR